MEAKCRLKQPINYGCNRAFAGIEVQNKNLQIRKLFSLLPLKIHLKWFLNCAIKALDSEVCELLVHEHTKTYKRKNEKRTLLEHFFFTSVPAISRFCYGGQNRSFSGTASPPLILQSLLPFLIGALFSTFTIDFASTCCTQWQRAAFSAIRQKRSYHKIWETLKMSTPLKRGCLCAFSLNKVYIALLL